MQLNVSDDEENEPDDDTEIKFNLVASTSVADEETAKRARNMHLASDFEEEETQARRLAEVCEKCDLEYKHIRG